MLSRPALKITPVPFRKAQKTRKAGIMSFLAMKWYDYGGQEARWHALWTAMVPYLPIQDAQLYQGASADLWADGKFGMTWACGGDVALNPGRFAPFVIPIMDGEDGTYCSHILLRPGVKIEQARVGLNQAHSQSGHLALARWWHQQGLPLPEVRVTGGHEASVGALLSGDVDLIAVDSQGYLLLLQATPALAQMTHVADTDRQLAPPLCLPGTNSCATHVWQDSVARFMNDHVDLAGACGIRGFIPTREGDYASLARTLQDQIAAGHVLTPLS